MNKGNFRRVTLSQILIMLLLPLTQFPTIFKSTMNTLIPGLGESGWVSPKQIPATEEENDHHIVPARSQHVELAFRKGGLLSIAQQNFTEASRWYAQSITKIFNGTPLRVIDQEFEMPS